MSDKFVILFVIVTVNNTFLCYISYVYKTIMNQWEVSSSAESFFCSFDQRGLSFVDVVKFSVFRNAHFGLVEIKPKHLPNVIGDMLWSNPGCYTTMKQGTNRGQNGREKSNVVWNRWGWTRYEQDCKFENVSHSELVASRRNEQKTKGLK